MKGVHWQTCKGCGLPYRALGTDKCRACRERKRSSRRAKERKAERSRRRAA